MVGWFGAHLFVLAEHPPPFRCPRCGFKSHNRHDWNNRYCVHCHQFFDESGAATF